MASLNLTLLPLFLLHLFYQFSEAEFSPSTANLSDPIIEDPCKNALCGEGKCRPDSLSLPFGYDCDCYKGWAKPKVLNLTVLPSCVIPDCNCGDNIDPPPPNITLTPGPTCDLHFGENPSTSTSTSASGASGTTNKVFYMHKHTLNIKFQEFKRWLGVLMGHAVADGFPLHDNVYSNNFQIELMMRGRTPHIIILEKAQSLHVLGKSYQGKNCYQDRCILTFHTIKLRGINGLELWRNRTMD
ncbi:hypothetical protein QJS04_geneDACA023910 [Acorus gramineus]|uniref:EGF-like domain-containing protein n=1 Tax=Acorus gramineus TaxID=55184 RepID=A0AAV9AK96_ACOGR|nr:hypothetical protein QJS04_geneDACA023910 [Acorus gramineus]